MMKVVWTKTARNSLQETYKFVTEVWDDTIADDFIVLLDERINQLQKNPSLAPKLKESEIHRMVIHKSVSLFYRIYPDYIKLLLLWDNRQNPKDLKQKLEG